MKFVGFHKNNLFKKIPILIGLEFLNGIVAHIFYVAVIFTAGALIGKPMYSWVVKKLPWTAS